MEYLISTVLVMTVAIAVSADQDGPYNNYIGNPDDGDSSHGLQQGYQGDGHGHTQGKDFYAEPHYAFAYEVHDDHTGDIKAHKEERKGDHTQGMYMLVEPNGSKRIVEYVVQGKSGFTAKVHQSKPQSGPSAPAKVQPGQGGYGGHSSGYTGGHQEQGYAGHSTNTGGPVTQSLYTGGHSANTGGQVTQSLYTGGYSGYGSYTGDQLSHNSYTPQPGVIGYYTGEDSATSGYDAAQSNPSYTNPPNSLGDYASGHYSTYNQPPYKVQEDNPSHNKSPYKPSYNLQSFKPLIPYTPSAPQHSKNTLPNNKPLVALYRPQNSYRPLTSNKHVIFKLIPVRKSGSNKHTQPHSNLRHATSSVSFSSHGSKIASRTNHAIPHQRRYENKH